MDEQKNKRIDLPETIKNSNLAIELSELPNAINDMHEAITANEDMIGEVKMKIDIAKSKIEKNVYFDDTLTNKDKREIKLKEKFSESVELIELNEKLNKLLKEKNSKDVQIKYLYNKFTAIKYLIRMLETVNQ